MANVYFKEKALACGINIRGMSDKEIWQQIIAFQQGVELYAREVVTRRQKPKPLNQAFSFKGFSGSCNEAEHNGKKFYHGKLLGIDALVTYEAETERELENEFRESVEAFLEF